MNEKKSLTVKDWADEDKPRERLLSQGKKQLTDAELLAILMRTGVPGKSVVELAKEILASTGNSLVALSRLDYSQLRTFKGMAGAKAATLMAALELGWRMHSEAGNSPECIINDSLALFNYLLPTLADLDHEEFWVVFLNNRNKVLGRQRISVGGQSDTAVDARVLYRAAIEAKATAIAVAHNHPSGTLKPSSNDRALTKRLKEAGDLLGIKMIEHIIIAIGPNNAPNYFSFSDEGLL
ncbi:MAG: DNA repair protein RadC [Bacteroidales bacterium]|nr:DNA repair protein RadC [Bacteroidales bacterium]